MNSGDSQAPGTMAMLSHTGSITPEDRRSAIAVFEQWQHQWPELFRGAAWLHLERLKKAVAETQANDR